jgi:hypothetical protein
VSMPQNRPPTAPSGDANDRNERSGSPSAGGEQEGEKTLPRGRIPSFAPSGPFNDISREPTVRWGEAPTRRLIFQSYAEQHELEVKRLQERLALLEETLPHLADMLAVVEQRYTLLVRNHATLTASARRELARLVEHLPGGIARFQAERAEIAELPQRIEYHKRAARVWRKRAALEV